MDKLKLATIIGTRPEIIRLSACISACDKYFENVLIHTGQNWDCRLNQVFFDELGLRAPDYDLSCSQGTPGERIGSIIAKSYEVLRKESPDALLILGDTNSALSAISAKRLKIPVFHMEAGNRCFDETVPEEINRRIIDHISDVNLPYTEHARRNLLAEGVEPKRIFVTGSPMREVLGRHRLQIEKSSVLERLGLKERQYILVSAHREENIDDPNNFLSLMTAINHVAEQFKFPVIYSTHPRSAKIITERGFEFHPLVHSLVPFGFFDYNKLQMKSFCVLSDSGTLSEESAILDFPAVLIRTSTERPEVLDKGTMVIGGVNEKDICQAVTLVTSIRDDGEQQLLPADYSDGNVSLKVVKIIQSYAKLVDREVWRKT